MIVSRCRALRLLAYFLALLVAGCSNSGAPSSPIVGLGSVTTPTPVQVTAAPVATGTLVPVVTAAPTLSPTPLPTNTPVPVVTPTPSSVSPVAQNAGSCEGSAATYLQCFSVLDFSDSPGGVTYGVYFLSHAANVVGNQTLNAFHAAFFSANPGSFAVTGTVISAAQGIIQNAPSTIAATTSGSLSVDFQESIEDIPVADPLNVLVPGKMFTCSIFDGPTLLGTATATIGTASASANDTSEGQVGCEGQYPSTSPAYPFDASFVMPNQIHAGDVYTFIISE